MKRIIAMLCACLFLLTGCSLLEGIELAPSEEPAAGDGTAPDSAGAAPEGGTQPELEPEGPKTFTLIFAEEPDEEDAVLLEAAQQAAESAGYTLYSVTSLGDPELQSRFLKLASSAGERVVLLELVDPAEAEEAIGDAGGMDVVFIGKLPESGLDKHAIYVGNPEGAGNLYLRATGQTAALAAVNLISGTPAAEETGLRLSGHKITVPADGVIETE